MTEAPTTHVADVVQARRRAVDEAVHSGEMEGLHVDRETLDDADRYVTGEIDVDELVRRTRARYGLV